MPYVHPKTWEDGVMPLWEFPEGKQAEIAEAVAHPSPPAKWIRVTGAHLPSRAWYEWHWARGRKLRHVPSGRPSRPKIPDVLRIAVYDRDGWRCLHCGDPESLTLDHIHPFSLGGPDTIDNLQTLCRPCNSRKGAKVDAS